VFVMKKETKIGMLMFAAALIIHQLHMSYLIFGILLGVCLCFLLISALPEKHYNTIKLFKRKIRKTTAKKRK